MTSLIFYISAKWEDAKLVKELHKIIKSHGHNYSSEWVNADAAKPYDSNIPLSEANAIRDINGVINSDVYIILTNKNKRGLGKYIEEGGAITLAVIKGSPLIYVIGTNVNESQFNFHPIIRRRQTENVEEELVKIIQEAENELLI